MPMSPIEKALRAQIAAHESWAQTTDRAGRTAPARRALEQKFLVAAGGDPVTRRASAQSPLRPHGAQERPGSPQGPRAVTAAAPVAAWPLPSLLTSLGRAGWGDLAGRSYHGTRAVLDGLHKLLPHGSAAGLATVAQVADASGYSKRWVEQKLYELEDMGLIEWRRGGIAYGKPRPSWFKVVKSKLVDLIYAARPALTKRLEARQRATAARLAGLPPFLRTRTGRKRRSAHVELSSTSSPYGRDRDGPLTVKGTSHSCNCCIEGWIDLPEGSAHCPTCRPKAAARWRQRARAS